MHAVVLKKPPVAMPLLAGHYGTESSSLGLKEATVGQRELHRAALQAGLHQWIWRRSDVLYVCQSVRERGRLRECVSKAERDEGLREGGVICPYRDISGSCHVSSVFFMTFAC